MPCTRTGILNEYTIIGATGCGTTSLNHWMKQKGFTVQYLDGDCYSNASSYRKEFKYRPVMIVRSSLKRHRSLEMKYGTCPTNTIEEKIKLFPEALIINMKKMEKVEGWRYINEHPQMDYNAWIKTNVLKRMP